MAQIREIGVQVQAGNSWKLSVQIGARCRATGFPPGLRATPSLHTEVSKMAEQAPAHILVIFDAFNTR